DNKIIKIDRIIGEVKPDECHELIEQHLPSTASGIDVLILCRKFKLFLMNI
uniref:Uncharacterized protein n=1 Tax=Amphimedon queenslandica TaxID=400682 RepID=A0A1X7SN64_AMPQE